jgi:hypothetical protein
MAAPTYGDAEALRQFLARQLDDGYTTATVRKSGAMAKWYFEWGYRAGHVNAATLLVCGRSGGGVRCSRSGMWSGEA